MSLLWLHARNIAIAYFVTLGVSDAPEATHNLPPKLVTLFETVGDILKKYRGGKLPKLFKLLPKYENWEQVR